MRKLLTYSLTAAFVCMGVGSSSAVPPLIGVGQTMDVIAPHHGPDAFHNPHYFAMTGDVDHFAWGSSTPATPGPIVIKYDFRAIGAFANVITAGQKANAVSAMSAWSTATGGKLSFVLDTVALGSDIINIGTGDLAALGFVSGVGGTLGLGGGTFSHGAATHSITSGVAWQDFAETWDTTIGNGNPAGTFDYFTVVAQEIGHAMGLGHTDNVGPGNIMNGGYVGEVTGTSATDVGHITSAYGASVIPEPGSLALVSLGLGAAGIGAVVRRRRDRSK